MTPYLAILKDSFREALASRVLWIVLVLITLLLAALAPFGYELKLVTTFHGDEIVNPQQLAARMYAASDEPPPAPGPRMWERWNSQTREELIHFALLDEDSEPTEFYDAQRQLQRALNRLVRDAGLYEAGAWPEARLPQEARELLALDPPTDEQRARLNRLLIQSTFPQHFQVRPREVVAVSYLWWTMPELPIGKDDFENIVELFVLSATTGLAGTLAVFIAILVTSPVIPQMFEPGALHLLLSKPISRSMLLLSKFLGGCAFVLLNMGYLNVGLWLIAGFRLGIWNHALLFAVPLFLFLFSIYYSVSALAGVIWRSAVVSVVLTILFWAACFSVGTTKAAMEAFRFAPERVVRVLDADGMLLAVSEDSRVRRWDASGSRWSPTFIAHGHPMRAVLGPFHVAEHRRLVAAQGVGGGRPQSYTLVVGEASGGYQPVEGPSTPEGTYTILQEPDGGLLTLSYSGIHRWDPASDVQAGRVNVLNLMSFPLRGGTAFDDAGPEPSLPMLAPLAAAASADRPELALYSRGRLWVLERDDAGRYQPRAERQVAEDEGTRAVVAMAGDQVVAALDDGRVVLLNAADLAERAEFRPERRVPPRLVRAAPGGRWFAVLYHHRRLVRIDAQRMTAERARVAGQGDVSAVEFSGEDHLWVADRTARLTRYRADDYAVDQRWQPESDWLETIYRYPVSLIYAVFPKPGELSNTLTYLLTGSATADIHLAQNLESPQEQLRPWAPVVSSLAFVVVVLLAGCLYIERQDF